MSLSDATLNAVSAVAGKLPSFRGQGRLHRMVSSAMMWLGVDPVVVAKMKDGTNILVDLRTGTELIAYYRGEYDSDLIQIIRSLFDVESYFLDVGANIGFYTISIAALIRDQRGSGKVIAFEPFEGNYKRLLENIATNDLEEYCSVEKIGLSNASVDSQITLREDFLRGSGTGNAAIPTNDQFDKGFKRVPIRLEPLDAVWKFPASSDRKIDIIKLDIEGHEDFFLQGGQQTIESHRPTILMEINKPYYVARGVELDSTFLPLIPSRYSIFRQAISIWKRIQSLDECSAYDNVFLVPEEKLEKSSGIFSKT